MATRKGPAVIELGDLITRAVRSPDVRRGINAQADVTMIRARSIASAAGANSFAQALTRVNGIRPGAKSQGGYRRPFARVLASTEGAEDVEHGGVGITRQSILARATGRAR